MCDIIIKSDETSIKKKNDSTGNYIYFTFIGNRAFSNEDAVYAYVKYCAASFRTQLERRRRGATLKNRRAF